VDSGVRWPLDAPTSWVPWQGTRGQGHAVRRPAIVELVARRVLTVQGRRRRHVVLDSRVPALASSDPALAMAIVARTGSAVLLVEAARPLAHALCRREVPLASGGGDG
jgi:hypothetical protein